MRSLTITFALNKELDKKMTRAFLQVKASGVDFGQGIISLHPALAETRNVSEEGLKQIVNQYIDTFYEQNDQILQACVSQMHTDWQQDEKQFIEQLDKLFHHLQVPEGKYIGYLSICNCNPRFLENKTFQVFYKHPSGSNYITAHEVLHFFFYDYVGKKYPNLFETLDPNSGIYWDLAELFNAVIMSSPDFISKAYSQNTKPYPNHVQYFSTLKAFWDEDPNIDSWVPKSYEYILAKKN